MAQRFTAIYELFWELLEVNLPVQSVSLFPLALRGGPEAHTDHLSEVDSPTPEWIFHSVELGRPTLSLSGGEAAHTQSGSAATV